MGFVGYGAEQLWQLHATDAALRSAIETGITLSALVSAVLLLAHFRQTRMLRDLLLLAALATVALTDFIFNALPAYHYQTGIYGAGARMALTILIAGIFLAVAFAPGDREVQAGRRLAAIAVPAAFYWVALGELVDLIAGPVREHGPSGAYAPLATSVSVTCCVVLIVSAFGFAMRHRDGDRAAGLLAAAAMCIAGAQLGKLGLGVAPPDWVTPSDALRVAGYGLLLATAVGMYRRSQVQVARDAVSAERLRIARDLHDGLAQDLAFIAAHSERLAREFGADHPLAIAATRALAASRGQIVDLEASHASSTEAALRAVAGELSSRFKVNVKVLVDDTAGPSAPSTSAPSTSGPSWSASPARRSPMPSATAVRATSPCGSARAATICSCGSPTMAAASASPARTPPGPGWGCAPCAPAPSPSAGAWSPARASPAERRSRSSASSSRGMYPTCCRGERIAGPSGSL